MEQEAAGEQRRAGFQKPGDAGITSDGQPAGIPAKTHEGGIEAAPVGKRSASCCGMRTEVYSRVVGYFRPVNQWNNGKREEFKNRVTFKVSGETIPPKRETKPQDGETDAQG